MIPRSVDSDLTTILAHWRLAQEAKKLSERTIAERAAIIRALVTFTGEHPLKLSADGIVRFIARPGLSPNSAVTYHAAIRAYCACWCAAADARPTLRC